MSEFLEKLSSYNLFNYLFPGVVFCLLADEFFSYSLIQDDIIVGVFLYYFIGLVISRIGSLIVEPILKKVGFISFAEYKDYIAASKTDPKIETLSEVNNMYRTVVALFFSLSLLAIYQIIKTKWPVVESYSVYAAILVIFFMFLFSYKKQTGYIGKRIESSKGK